MIEQENNSNSLKVKVSKMEQADFVGLHPEMKNEKNGTIKVNPCDDIDDRECVVLWMKEDKLSGVYSSQWVKE